MIASQPNECDDIEPEGEREGGRERHGHSRRKKKKKEKKRGEREGEEKHHIPSLLCPIVYTYNTRPLLPRTHYP